MLKEFKKAQGHTYYQRNFVPEVLKDQHLPIKSDTAKMDRLE